MEAQREPAQAVPEGEDPADEVYHAMEVRSEWTDAGTELLALA